jgi:hypothetical protein
MVDSKETDSREPSTDSRLLMVESDLRHLREDEITYLKLRRESFLNATKAAYSVVNDSPLKYVLSSVQLDIALDTYHGYDDELQSVRTQIRAIESTLSSSTVSERTYQSLQADSQQPTADSPSQANKE